MKDPTISAQQYEEMREAGEVWWFTYFVRDENNAIERLKATYAEHVPMADIRFEPQGDGTTALRIAAPIDEEFSRTMMFATQMLHAGFDHAGLDRSLVEGATLFEDPKGLAGQLPN